MSNFATPLPLELSPSWTFDGDDGSWSSFALTVGSPAQSFRVFPSTSGSEVWLPLPQGCQGILSGVGDCGDLRGVNAINGTASSGFQTNVSSTWDLIGIYDLAAEQNLFDNISGQYGLDRVSLELLTESNNNSSATVDAQTVAGFASGDLWLGSLGLGTAQANFTVQNENVPSLLETLKTQNLSTSLTVGYAAGAAYASPADYGSLILGGYDQSRNDDNITISLGGADNQTLGVSVQNILAENTIDGTVSLFQQPAPLIATIDSTTSQLWLPQSLCDLFASAFGLTYDSVTGLYLVNDTIHNQLQQSNPTITFTIGPNTTETDSINTNIVFHYAAFDLQAGIPIYNSSTNYFPLRVAANESQYTLGRAFLQEAYIFVDWERQGLTIGQVVHQNTTKNIVPVLPPSNNGGGGGEALSSGAIAGIAVGASVGIVSAVGILLFCILGSRRRRRRMAEDDADQKPEIETADAYMAESKSDAYLTELDSKHVRPQHELMSEQVHELAEENKRSEMMGTPLAEMADQPVGSELEDSSDFADKKKQHEVFELP
ncbi:hypothetical protein B0A50_01155 [Salinomyces thailandicus]|uniref:Peptidase A1 domain-containing protein n=1 Tax=Salinomyces thailandicus TaxID=706561 RepID=A0A4V5N5R5_9PEZI|nr:hypothetical protein B0A50_01155 [Salinomyces thailandica]